MRKWIRIRRNRDRGNSKNSQVKDQEKEKSSKNYEYLSEYSMDYH